MREDKELGQRMEQARPIPHHPGYFVTRDGCVLSTRSNRSLPPGPRKMKLRHSRRGYVVVGLWVGRKMYMRSVHRLVALAFHGQPPSDRAMVRHLDGDKTNNTAANLAYGSAKENAADDFRLGRVPFGTRRYNAKLSATHVRWIRVWYWRLHYDAAAIGRAFGVSGFAVLAVARGTAWPHVPFEVL